MATRVLDAVDPLTEAGVLDYAALERDVAYFALSRDLQIARYTKV